MLSLAWGEHVVSLCSMSRSAIPWRLLALEKPVRRTKRPRLLRPSHRLRLAFLPPLFVMFVFL